MKRDLNVVPDDFSRAMAVVAHADDLEYGTAGAIARTWRVAT